MQYDHERFGDKSMEALEVPAKIRLLRKMIEVVMWEWNAVQEGRWEELATYGARKQALIQQMQDYDWTPIAEDRENPEILILEAQIIDLEYQVKKMLESRMQVLSTQMEDLKQRSNNWRKVVNPYKQAAAMK
jgi:Flagellar protein FliT